MLTYFVFQLGWYPRLSVRRSRLMGLFVGGAWSEAVKLNYQVATSMND